MADFDVVIIGGGPAGYVCAIRSAQLGMKTVCIDKRDTLGGTCLNVGCIPSKALLQSSYLYEQALHGLSNHGVELSNVGLNLKTLMTRKESLVSDLCKGIDYLFKKNKITRMVGNASIIAPGQVQVDGKEVVSAKNIIIATGSEPTSLPGIEIDEGNVVSSTGALKFSSVPKHLVIIGGGYIGLEMGSVWKRLGSEVTVVEFFDRIVPAMDVELGRALHKSLEKQGIEFKLSTKVSGVNNSTEGLALKLESAAGEDLGEIKCDKILVSTGRKAYTQGLGLEALGISLDDRGRIPVDKYFCTSVPGIYAIGDVIAGPMLAHKGEEEGVAVAEILAGQSGHVNYDTIPGVVYTHPEAATVGLTEEQVREKGIAYKVGKFPFSANSRAKANGDTEGFVKIIADAGNDRVLGVHIIGPEAGTLIAEAVLGMEYMASSEDIARTCHAHPSLNEAVKEAALDVLGRAIHS